MTGEERHQLIAYRREIAQLKQRQKQTEQMDKAMNILKYQSFIQSREIVSLNLNEL